MLVMSYSNGTDRWELALPVAAFDLTTLAYTGVGPTHPEEISVTDSFLALGAVWAPYFDPSWTLTIEAINWSDGTMSHRLPATPDPGGVLGTSSVPASTGPPVRRGWTFRSRTGLKVRVRFIGIATMTMSTHRVVTATMGGIDARDVAVVAYLSSARTGFVMSDGNGFPPSAFVWERLQLLPFERAAPVTPPGAAGSEGSIYITFGGTTTPLPPGQPGDVLTLDPGAGVLLPVWSAGCCPDVGAIQPPIPTVPLGGGNATQEAVNQVVCGMAQAMADWVIATSDKIRQLMNAIITGHSVVGRAQLLLKLWQILQTEGGGATGNVQTAVSALMGFLLSLLPGHVTGTYPALTTHQKKAILCDAYAALPKSGGSAAITADELYQWRSLVARDMDYPSDFNSSLVVLTMLTPSLDAWRARAYQGSLSPSTNCTVCTGAALQGGAAIGQVSGAALQGGALIGGVVGAAVQGGAAIGGATGLAVQGGATIS